MPRAPLVIVAKRKATRLLTATNAIASYAISMPWATLLSSVLKRTRCDSRLFLTLTTSIGGETPRIVSDLMTTITMMTSMETTACTALTLGHALFGVGF